MGFRKYKRPLIFNGILLLVAAAAFADIKYKGKMYQMLPRSLQDYLNS